MALTFPDQIKTHSDRTEQRAILWKPIDPISYIQCSTITRDFQQVINIKAHHHFGRLCEELYNEFGNICFVESDMMEKPHSWILPRPKRLHHVLEDFLTSWTAPQSHILPLRRFLEFCIGGDLRNFFADSCFKYSLTHVESPITCQTHYLPGRGLVPTSWTTLKSATSMVVSG